MIRGTRKQIKSNQLVSLHPTDDPAAPFRVVLGGPVASGGGGVVRVNAGSGVGPLHGLPVGVHGADRRFVYAG
jgi:hypothetical protein